MKYGEAIAIRYDEVERRAGGSHRSASRKLNAVRLGLQDHQKWFKCILTRIVAMLMLEERLPRGARAIAADVFAQALECLRIPIQGRQSSHLNFANGSVRRPRLRLVMDPFEAYRTLKDTLLLDTGLPDHSMHVHCGLAIYVLAQLALRTRRGSLKALMIVTLLEVTNEVMDRLYWGSWRWTDTSLDFAATLFWPTVFAATSLYRRRRWRVGTKLQETKREISYGPRSVMAQAVARQSDRNHGKLSAARP